MQSLKVIHLNNNSDNNSGDGPGFSNQDILIENFNLSSGVNTQNEASKSIVKGFDVLHLKHPELKSWANGYEDRCLISLEKLPFNLPILASLLNRLALSKFKYIATSNRTISSVLQRLLPKTEVYLIGNDPAKDWNSYQKIYYRISKNSPRPTN